MYRGSHLYSYNNYNVPNRRQADTMRIARWLYNSRSADFVQDYLDNDVSIYDYDWFVKGLNMDNPFYQTEYEYVNTSF